MSMVMKKLAVLSLGVLATVACAAQPTSEKQDTASKSQIVARMGDRVIRADELEKIAGGSLIKLRQQMYEAKKRAIEKYAYDLMVDQKAKAEGLSRDEWLKKNLEAQVPKPTDEEIASVMKQYRSRLAKDDDQARNQVVAYLTQRARRGAEDALRKKLEAEAGLKILLEPPRLDAKVREHNPTRGPELAPVTLIEYTDFQCPYCGRSQATLEALRERYGKRIRFVFKNLPLPMHQNSRSAAEAAMCAKDQGKFWEMHDWLFANHTKLGQENILKQAEKMGLDVEALKKCINDKVHSSEIDQDVEEAQSFGITGTPGFIINGRLLTGAQPVENFESVINEELTRRGVDIPPKVETPNTAETENGSTGAVKVRKKVAKASS